MAVLPLTTASNPLLRQKARKVSRIDASIQKLIDDMVETMHAANGVGLAAPQVGVPLRLAVIQLPADSDEPMAGELIVLINPEIVKSSGTVEMDEGCLSLPGYVGKVRRAEKVTVKALDRQGRPFRLKAEGLLAEAIQHEIDHLNGVLFFDHLVENEVLRPVRQPEAEEEEPL